MIIDFLILAILLTSISAEARLAPKDLHEFNKTCPTPKLCDEMSKNIKSCKGGDKKQCDVFLDNLRKALPEYDCQRPYDSTPTARYIVPAIWLCKQGGDSFYEFLSKMKTEKALKLFGSKEFRTVLDGESAEEYFYKSEKIGKTIHGSR